MLSGHLRKLENEAIHILREGVTQARKPVLLFSGGKDSTVLAHLAVRAFYPARPPLPLMHIDSTWEFTEILRFRDAFAEAHGFDLIVEWNREGQQKGISPFEHGSAFYTETMRTEPLKAAIDRHGFDIIFGGARRDEERSRAKERIFSIRGAGHAWDPRAQRPEFWNLYNATLLRGQTIRAFPLSNWTEADIWAYAAARDLELAPLYFAASRPVVDRDGTLIVVNDTRFPFRPNEAVSQEMVRFRTVGCWPVTGAVRSTAMTLAAVAAENLSTRLSERQGRLVDADDGSLESKKRAGYF